MSFFVPLFLRGSTENLFSISPNKPEKNDVSKNIRPFSTQLNRKYQNSLSYKFFDPFEEETIYLGVEE